MSNPCCPLKLGLLFTKKYSSISLNGSKTSRYIALLFSGHVYVPVYYYLTVIGSTLCFYMGCLDVGLQMSQNIYIKLGYGALQSTRALCALRSIINFKLEMIDSNRSI
jgi:hypothetical protein